MEEKRRGWGGRLMNKKSLTSRLLLFPNPNFLGVRVLLCSRLQRVKGVYHVMVSTVEPLQGTDSKLLSSNQFCSSSHNSCCYD